MTEHGIISIISISRERERERDRKSQNSGLNTQTDTQRHIQRNNKVTYWAPCRSQKLVAHDYTSLLSYLVFNSLHHL